MERTDRMGDPSEAPEEYLELELPDGIVLERAFVERTKPEALHGEEQLEEDDSFLSIGSETWDYEVADNRQDEFLAAVRNSRMAMECQPLD